MTDDLGPLPLLHARHVPVELARRELMGFLLDWQQKHGLTQAEYLDLVVASLRDRTASLVRAERAE